MKNNDAIYDFAQYLAEKGVDLDTESDMVKHLNEYIQQTGIRPEILLDSLRDDETLSEANAEDAADYLELAQGADSAKEALRLAKKALTLEPENWDAAAMVAQISANSLEALLEKYEKLIQEANAVMIRDGWFDDEYIGEFWGLLETRPYMRLRRAYLATLIECSMLKKAIVQAKDMLRLCEDDNLGVRYLLMHLFACFEDEESARELYARYPEDSSMMLLPQSILYYKLGDLKKSTQYLRKLQETNKDTLRFFKTIANGDVEELFEEISPFGYQPFTIQELIEEFQENTFLFGQSTAFFDWSLRKLKGMKKTKK